MAKRVEVGDPELRYDSGVRLPVHDYPVEFDGQKVSVRVYDTVAFAGGLYGEEMKQFIVAFVRLALEVGWPLVLDENTAIPTAEFLGWSGRFGRNSIYRSHVI